MLSSNKSRHISNAYKFDRIKGSKSKNYTSFNKSYPEESIFIV